VSGVAGELGVNRCKLLPLEGLAMRFCCVAPGTMSSQVFCPFFTWVVGFFAVELYKLLVYSRDEALVSFII